MIDSPICELPSENDLITILFAIRSKVDSAFGDIDDAICGG